jgi:ABC-type phosphate/phosphonate transport system substrate-binding protein
LLFTVFLIGLLLPQASFAKEFIVSVAPSYPIPVSLMTPEDTAPTTKKLKFEKAEEPIKKSASYEKVPGKNEIWEDVFSYISKETGIDLIFEPATSQLDFELNLAKSHYDLAFLSPIQFDAFRLNPGYQAQLKRKAQPIRAIIFVKKNGSIKSFSELRNAIIAFPNPLNFESSIVPRESLKRLNFNIIPQFLPTESAVYKEVIREQYIAGSGTHENFLAQPVEIRNSLKVIWDSPGFSPHAFVAHPRVDFFSLVKLKRAFVDMIKNEDAKKLLPYIFVDNGFEVARDSDWDEIKLIDLNELNGSIKNTQAK